MHHHAKPFVDGLHAERTAHQALPADTTELERLVARAARSDDTAWASLIARFAPRVHAVARQHRLSEQDAEDVAQLTWLQLMTHIGSVREPGKLGAYVHTIARRQSMRRRAASSREECFDDCFEPCSPDDQCAESMLLARERSDALEAALLDLPAHQRRLMELMITDPEPSYAEISERLGMPVGSIGPTRARSLERLRRDPQLAGMAD